MPRRNNTPKHQPYIDKNTCQSKRRFESELTARKSAEVLELQHNEGFSVYNCDRCAGWHLTRRATETAE